MNPIQLRKRVVKCCTGIVLATMMSACGSDGNPPSTPPATPPATPAAVSFATDIQPILNANCIKCHTLAGPAGNILVLDIGAYNNLVNRPAVTSGSTGTLVVPSDSVNSVFYERISKNGLQTNQLQMPLGGPFLSAAQQTLIKTWIDQGAKNN
jgi:hypothetical protein